MPCHKTQKQEQAEREDKGLKDGSFKSYMKFIESENFYNSFCGKNY